MISGQYGKVVSRYLRPVVSELVNKLSTDIDTDLFPAIDPLGTGYISRVVNLAKSGVIAQNQGLYMLQQAEILPQELPEPSNPNNVVRTLKGGEENGKD